MHKKLFIPGPVEVQPRILEAMSKPVVGHRSQDFQKLFSETTSKLKKLMYTENICLISTSSGSGLMEAAIRNCVGKDVLNTVCGIFSKKWHDIAERCGKHAEKLEVEFGKAIKPEMVKDRLETGNFDAICITHNETTTGVTNPIEEISRIVKEFPDVLLLVDAVSSLGGVKIEVDKLGLDVCLSSSQKALGLPPGLAVASVSAEAFKRAEEVENRGYYFDLLELKKSYEKNMTPYTPSISHINALNTELDLILEEGLERRFERHMSMAEKARRWAKEQGFELFSEKGYESDTVTCVANTRGIDLSKVKKKMEEKGYVFDTGHRKLNAQLKDENKPDTFRLAHMGDIQGEELLEFLDALESCF